MVNLTKLTRLWLCLCIPLLLACPHDDNPVNGDDDGDHTIKPGEWTATADFGTMDFVVGSEGETITEISYNFDAWSCGGATRSGTITTQRPSGWRISNRNIQISIDFSSVHLEMTIEGSFAANGDQASGTFEAVSYGTTCSGDWIASPADIQMGVVSGTLTLPQPAPGHEYVVMVDEDSDGGNGYVAMTSGVCGEGTSVEFSADDVPPGDYYVYAAVRMVSTAGNPPEDGDYYGILGGTLSNPPSQPNVEVPASGSVVCNITLDVLGAPPVTVTGTLTLPAAAPGKTYFVSVDNDFNGDNGYVEITTGTCGSGTTVGYEIEDVPAGDYYVYAGVWVAGTYGHRPEDGDYLGIYGGTVDAPPSQPNVEVPSTGSVVCDIDLELLEPEPLATVTGTLILPEAAPGKTYLVLILGEAGDEESLVDSTSGVCGSGSTVEYSIDNVPAGTYYVLAAVSDKTFGEGDYVGIYGGTVDNIPTQPNATVPSSGTVTFDIILEEIGGETACPASGQWSGTTSDGDAVYLWLSSDEPCGVDSVEFHAVCEIAPGWRQFLHKSIEFDPPRGLDSCTSWSCSYAYDLSSGNDGVDFCWHIDVDDSAYGQLEWRVWESYCATCVDVTWSAYPDGAGSSARSISATDWKESALFNWLRSSFLRGH